MPRRFDAGRHGAYTADRLIRANALLVVWMLLPWASVPAALLHAHADAGHRHDAHRHGPSWHTHDSGTTSHAASLDPSGHRLERCDPAANAVDVAPAVTTERHAPDITAPPSGTELVYTPSESRLPVQTTEPRAHGPPGRPAAPLRAPPASTFR
jgi:hypothetical protein